MSNVPRETDALLEHAERGRVVYQATSWWSNIRHRHRKAFAEFLGTAILVTFGSGAIAQTVLSPNGSWLGLTLGWGLGLTIGIYVSGGISGGHLNPAVTLALAIFRKFSWAELPSYWLSQFTGAFVGAAAVYSFNHAAIKEVGYNASTAGIFVTGLQNEDIVAIHNAFFAELLGTALLLIIILATSDKGNQPAHNLQPLIIGLGLTLIGTSFGWETGFALNPARDLAPRLFTAISGWGFGVFTQQSWYFWVPIVAPLAGGIVGTFLYDSLVYAGPSILNGLN